jgi:hypothetical protein
LLGLIDSSGGKSFEFDIMNGFSLETSQAQKAEGAQNLNSLGARKFMSIRRKREREASRRPEQGGNTESHEGLEHPETQPRRGTK